MKLLAASPILLFTALLFAGCDSDKDQDPTAPVVTFSTKAILVSEDGAPPAVLGDAQVGETLYQGNRASFRVSGKLLNGSIISLSFRQTTPSLTGANKTDVVSGTLNTTIYSTQASGTTVRDPSTNTVSGSFSATFANGATVSGTINSLELP